MAITNSLTTEDNLKRIVSAGGGQWVGLQGTFLPDREPLVLFNSPTSKTTLALPVNLLTEDNVRGKIAGSNDAFMKRPVLVPRVQLQRFADKLEAMYKEVNQLLSGE